MIERIAQDLCYAFRSFVRAPGFAVLAISTMAIGVGANAAIFSVVNAVLLRPLPFRVPAALVLLTDTNKSTRQSLGNTAPATYLDWKARSRSFSAMAAFHNDTYTATSADHPERLGGAIVDANFFDVLGVAPLLGRAFAPTDQGSGARRVVVLGHAMWMDRFGGRPDAIGQTLRLNGEPHTVVGVMPPGIDYPERAALWTPPHWPVPDDSLALDRDPSTQRNHGYLRVIARVKPGVMPAQAQAEMDAVAAALERDFPTENRNVGVAVGSLRDDLIGNIRPTLWLLFAAVGVLLLIAIANVSGLLIARATARQQEMSVRMAIGATRSRILVQLLTESLMLSVLGGASGVLLSMWLVVPLTAISPGALGISGDVPIDWRVLGFGLAVSTFAGLVFGLAPARQLLDANLHNDLKQSARGGSSRAQRRLRATLVSGEIALSLVLLIAAGLTIKSLIRLQQVPAGFDAEHVLTLGISPPPVRYAQPEQRADLYQRSLESLASIPGVEAVGGVNRLPLSGGNSTRGLVIDGRQQTNPEPSADFRTVSPDYFRALRIPLVAGRALRDDDREGRPLVAVISVSMAQRFWPGISPIGHRMAITPNDPITVVGVVGDVHHASLEAAPQPTLYVPYRQSPWPGFTFVLRSSGDTSAIASAARDAIWRADKDLPISALRTMDEQLARSTARRRFSVTLLTAFGVIAAALAAIGLYGVLAFIVAQRRREIGVRMALGATPRAVIADVLSQGMRVAGIGVATGIVLALIATRLLNSLLFGTSRTDVATFTGVAAVLVVIAGVASVVPALRASRVDPLIALRDE
jgi:putative ABC transport system permease protein